MNNQLKNDLVTAYDGSARKRNENSLQNWKIIERDIFCSLLMNEQKVSLLEIGAGTGKDSLFFQDQGFDVISTDLSPEMVKFCVQKGINAKVMDFEDIKFSDESFDAIYGMNCLLHLPKKDLPKVLNSISTKLKQNGLFFMGVYGGYSFEDIWEEDNHHPKRFFSFYEDDSLKQIASNVFEIVSFRKIKMDFDNSDLHFQSFILRK